jgi:hypothetical protein
MVLSTASAGHLTKGWCMITKCATCLVCGGRLEAEQQEMDRGVCLDCSSIKGKLGEVSLELGIARVNKKESDLSEPHWWQWRVIRSLVRQRLRGRLDSDQTVYESLCDWLLSEYEQRQSELVPPWPGPESKTGWLLRIPLAKVIEILKAVAAGAGQSHSSGAKSNGSQLLARDPAIEARDKWLYEQCCKLVRYEAIIRRLDKKTQTWLRITTPQGIKKAAAAYAERQIPKLPPIPKRARGRIKGK